jgi:hypothetical protein
MTPQRRHAAITALKGYVRRLVPSGNLHYEDCMAVIKELEEIPRLRKQIKDLEQRNSDLGWQTNPDRMGR